MAAASGELTQCRFRHGTAAAPFLGAAKKLSTGGGPRLPMLGDCQCGRPFAGPRVKASLKGRIYHACINACVDTSPTAGILMGDTTF